MKYLLMALLIASCGKHQQPAAQDLHDSDGDGEPNALEVSELDKFTADIAPIENVKVEMRIKVGTSIITDLKVNLSNKIDLTKHSRELLVKNSKTLAPDEYFSEWSKLKIDSEKFPTLPDQSSFRVDLCFNQMNTPPDKLLLINKEGSRFLSEWSPLINLVLTKKETQDILSGEAFISLGRNIKRFQNSTESQDDSIKNKTYRVFMNDGNSTKIHYVSREFSFERFLAAQGVHTYQNISNQNLLTARHSTSMPEWWVNEINSKDKVVIKDDLKSLSDFYLQSLEKKVLKTQRTNGAALTSVSLINVGESRTLLKIRVQKNMTLFSYIDRNSSYGGHGGGKEGSPEPGTKCVNSYRSISGSAPVEITELELRKALHITSNGVEVSMAPTDMEIWRGKDENGIFFEIAFQTVDSTIEVKLKNLENASFVGVGLYATTCQEVKIKTIPSNNEAFLNLSIEAYTDTL